MLLPPKSHHDETHAAVAVCFADAPPDDAVSAHARVEPAGKGVDEVIETDLLQNGADLLLGVHDERTLLDDGLADRATLHDQEFHVIGRSETHDTRRIDDGGSRRRRSVRRHRYDQGKPVG